MDEEISALPSIISSRNNLYTAASVNHFCHIDQGQSRAASRNRTSPLDVSTEPAPLGTSSRSSSRNEPRPPSRGNLFENGRPVPDGASRQPPQSHLPHLQLQAAMAHTYRALQGTQLQCFPVPSTEPPNSGPDQLPQLQAPSLNSSRNDPSHGARSRPDLQYNFRPITQRLPGAAARNEPTCMDVSAEMVPLATSSRSSSRNESRPPSRNDRQEIHRPVPEQASGQLPLLQLTHAQIQAAMAQTYRTIQGTQLQCLPVVQHDQGSPWFPPEHVGPDSRPSSRVSSRSSLSRLGASSSSELSGSSDSSGDSPWNLTWPPPSLQEEWADRVGRERVVEWQRQSVENRRQRVSREVEIVRVPRTEPPLNPMPPHAFNVDNGGVQQQIASSGSGSGSSSSADVSGEEIPIPPAMYGLQRQAMMASLQFCHHRMQGLPVLRQACFVCNSQGCPR